MLLVIAGIVVIIITIRHLATQLTKPIVALNDVAQELAEGNLDVTLDIASENEIGELADSIQKTVDRLKEYINYIDEISSVLDRLADGKLKFTLKYDYAGEFAKVKTALLHISGSFEQMNEISLTVLRGIYRCRMTFQGCTEYRRGCYDAAASVQELVATTESVSQR